MDGERFDQLTRRLVRRADRRAFVAGLVGAVAGGLFGVGDAGAAVCRMPGDSCREGANCCSGVCGPKETGGRHRCLCQSPADCPAPRRCRAATCEDGVCGTRITAGDPCDDGNACTTDDVCGDDGGCRGTPIPCHAIDACHVAGVCDRRTGVCSNPPAPAKTVCGSAPDLCHLPPACDGAGACVDGDPVVCTAKDSCHAVGTCDLGTGACSNPQLPDETACALPGGGSGHCCGGVCRECCADGDCGTGRTCSGGTCVCDPATCAGCCAGNACVGGNDSGACGHGGVTCAVCQSPQTCGGGGTAGVCGCTPDCQGRCGGVSDGCGGTCGACPTCQRCQAGGFCFPVTDRTSCGEGGQICISGFCTQCIAGGEETANGVCNEFTVLLCCSGVCVGLPDQPFDRCCTDDGCCIFDAQGNPQC
jgi:hypothetical protein